MIPRPHDPQGTLEDLKQYGLDKRKYGSCSEPVGKTAPAKQQNLGCAVWDQCPMRDGPKNVRTRLFKPGGLMRQGWCSCFEAIRQRLQYNLNDERTFQILDGNEVTIRISKERPLQPGQGLPTFEEELQTVSIPKFAGLDQSSHAVAEQERKLVRDEMSREKRRARLAGALNMEKDDVELDSEQGEEVVSPAGPENPRGRARR